MLEDLMEGAFPRANPKAHPITSTAAGLVALLAGVHWGGHDATAAPVVLSEVPAYRWYHGCGPTAAAAVLGYWDLQGYANLFDASGEDLYWTDNVKDQISSPEHNAKYDHEDDANLPVPPMASIADWFGTSVDPLDYGWSYLSHADDAFIGYADYRGYEFDAWYESLGSGLFTWEELMTEIDGGRPMMFLVDSDGNGGTDHFVPVLGYDDRGDEGLWYGVYSVSIFGELENVLWKQFRPMSGDYKWGVGHGIFVHPVPEPAALILIALGTIVLRRPRPTAGRTRRRAWRPGRCDRSASTHRGRPECAPAAARRRPRSARV